MPTAVKLYDANNQLMDVQNGVAIPANTSGILAHGSDGTTARALTTDTSGRPVMVGPGVAGTPAGGLLTVQGAVGAAPQPIANGRVTSFMASTNGSISSGTAAATVTSIAYLFHSGASTKTIRLRRITVSANGTTGVAGGSGNLVVRGAFITAENATPGGTSQTINGTNRANVVDATDVFRSGATGAPVRVTGDLISATFAETSANNYEWYPDIEGGPITLRAGIAEGFEIRTVIGVALTTALQVSVTCYWTEE